MIQFNKKINRKSRHEFNKNSSKIIKIKINFQHNFNTTSTQIQGVLFNQCIIKLLYNHASFFLRRILNKEFLLY